MPEPLIEKIHAPVPYARDLLLQNGIRGINCGCGRTLKPGCLNVDKTSMVDARGTSSEPGEIVRILVERQHLYYMEHDLTKAFPIASHSFSWGYSEHFIEHVPYEQAIGWLTEMRRLIAPGGLLRVTTPDLKKYIDGYADPEGRFFEVHAENLESSGDKKRWVPRRRAWMVNQIFHFHQHQWIYDFDEVVYAATVAGFDPGGITQREFQSGLLEDVFMMDSPARNDETLYVELAT